MSDLKLESLRIQNFRTFKDLTIDRLGRVNLIVGKNNVGKTSLLEAINIYVRGGTGTSIDDVVHSRDLEDLDEYRSTSTSDFGVKLPPERHLFHGRPYLESVGPDDEELPEISPIRITSSPSQNRAFELKLELSSSHKLVSTQLEVGGEPGMSSRVLGEKTLSIFLTARDIRAEAAEYWNRIELTEGEQRVVRALNIVDKNSEVEGVGFASVGGNGDARSVENHSARFPIARRKGQNRPEPLSNLGEGMNRAFALSIALLRARDGILLVDEIENGIHHSVQARLWRMIFETARELDVQVFATTHSYDCVQAFQRVADDYKDEEGMLVQLRRKRTEPKKIVAVTVDEEELQDAFRFQVDPR